jgi:magnesium transporter
MLNIFTLANGRLVQEEIEALEELSKFQPIWVDLESPTLEEKRWIKQYYGLSIPEDAMDEDIEESARFYEEDNGELHIRSDFLIADDEDPRTVRVAFILNQHNTDLRSRGVLFSIHDEDVPVFRLLRMRARRAPGLIEDAKEVLLKLFDADAEYSADTLENIYDELEVAGKKVLSGNVTDELAGEVLGAIARQEDLNGRIRRNVMDTRRAVSFMMRSKHAQRRAVRRSAADPARHRIAGQPHGVSVRQDQLPDGRHRRLHQHQPEQDHQDLLGGQRGAAAAHADRQHLRHELQVHARARLVAGLPLRAWC